MDSSNVLPINLISQADVRLSYEFSITNLTEANEQQAYASFDIDITDVTTNREGMFKSGEFVDILDEKFVLTREGYSDMQRELNEIITIKRPRVVDRIREARQLGDLSENFDYEDAKRAQAMLEARVKELKAILAHATVIDVSISAGFVNIGTRVVVKNLNEGFDDEYTIVGTAESSPSEGKISHESCVGKELLNKKVGERVFVDTPGGVVQYEVVAIS